MRIIPLILVSAHFQAILASSLKTLIISNIQLILWRDLSKWFHKFLYFCKMMNNWMCSFMSMQTLLFFCWNTVELYSPSTWNWATNLLSFRKRKIIVNYSQVLSSNFFNTRLIYLFLGKNWANSIILWAKKNSIHQSKSMKIFQWILKTSINSVRMFILCSWKTLLNQKRALPLWIF